MVHAGAKGKRDAVICALDLSPTQLRIADEVSAALTPRENPKPEIARINKEGMLQAEFWSTG
jgi:septum site-determining protein MinC